MFNMFSDVDDLMGMQGECNVDEQAHADRVMSGERRRHQ